MNAVAVGLEFIFKFLAYFVGESRTLRTLDIQDIQLFIEVSNLPLSHRGHSHLTFHISHLTSHNLTDSHRDRARTRVMRLMRLMRLSIIIRMHYYAYYYEPLTFSSSDDATHGQTWLDLAVRHSTPFQFNNRIINYTIIMLASSVINVINVINVTT